jgi:hypothetical protein
MIEPTMNARPPRKKSLSKTSAAAVTLSANPVSEIALGVSRDDQPVPHQRRTLPAGPGATLAWRPWPRR